MDLPGIDSVPSAPPKLSLGCARDRLGSLGVSQMSLTDLPRTHSALPGIDSVPGRPWAFPRDLPGIDSVPYASLLPVIVLVPEAFPRMVCQESAPFPRRSLGICQDRLGALGVPEASPIARDRLGALGVL
eukprot:9312516-Pyramimonas_sp.AAC.1